jgi:hypothetical protein
MSGYVIVPPWTILPVIESGPTHVEAPPLWVVATLGGTELSAHLTESAARAWSICSDVRASDPMPEDEPDDDRECLCPVVHDDPVRDYCRGACRPGQSVCDACRDCEVTP